MDKVSLTGKNIIVTGANTGIGYEAALDLAKRGANIILACRDATRAQVACDKIKAESKNENIEVEILDLGELKSVKEFSDRIIAKWTHLDILINNAGLYHHDYKKTNDGFEIHFGVNYLGPYYLTRLLLDLIKKSAPSRIINVSSTGYESCKSMNWDDLNFEKDYGALKAYCQSKLGNVLFTNELAKKLEGSGVSVASLHPGFVSTDIFRGRENQSWKATFLAMFVKAATIFAKNSKTGAETTIYCAVSDDIPKNSGAYYDNSKEKQKLEQALNSESDERLWNVSAKLVGLEP